MKTLVKQDIKDAILMDFIIHWNHNTQVGGFFSRKLFISDGLLLIYTIMFHTPDFTNPCFEAFYIEGQVESHNEYERIELTKDMVETINSYINDPDTKEELNVNLNIKNFEKEYSPFSFNIENIQLN